MPVRVAITESTRVDCKEAVPLIVGIDVGYLLADKAYNTDEIIAYAVSQDMKVVISSKSNRKSNAKARKSPV